MVSRFVVVSTLSLTLSACNTTATLYPVQGPLSSQILLPIITATADGIMGNTGNISLVLPPGEHFTGRWSSIAPTYAGSGALFTQYGNIVGFSVAGIRPGINPGQAFLACAKGSKIEAEFYTGSGTANGFGIAKDSNGNVYKMLF